MDTLQCAIVLAKLDRFDWEVAQRIEIGNRYNQLMDGAGIIRVQQCAGRTSVYAQYTVLIENREHVQAHLTKLAIPTAVHYPIPLDQQEAYKKYGYHYATPVSFNASKKVMSLPMSAELTSEQQNIIFKHIVNAKFE